MENGEIVFDKELYEKNIKEHTFYNDETAITEEDLKQLKKDGIINE